LEKDKSNKECNPDSSKPDNVVGYDYLLLSALKNDVGDTSLETSRTFNSIVSFIFGSEEDDDNLKNDHTLLQENFEKVRIGENLNGLSPGKYNEKKFQLKETQDNEDWKPELDHLHGLLAT